MPSESSDKESRNQVHGHVGVDGIKRLSVEKDYFTRSTEFRFWLSESKGKAFEKLSSEDARRYFKKFVRKWNDGDLGDDFYNGTVVAPKTKFNWGFTDKMSKKERDTLEEAKSSAKTSKSASTTASRPFKGPVLGPSLPSDHSYSALVSKREEERETLENSRSAERFEKKKRRREEREEERDSRATGRERMIEKKKEMNASNRAFAEKDDGLGDFGEDQLMGAGGSFQAAIRARDRAKGRREKEREEKEAIRADKMRDMRAKEDKTMAMLRQMAESRFGKG